MMASRSRFRTACSMPLRVELILSPIINMNECPFNAAGAPAPPGRAWRYLQNFRRIYLLTIDGFAYFNSPDCIPGGKVCPGEFPHLLIYGRPSEHDLHIVA